MSTSFTVTATSKPNNRTDNVSVGDIVKYEFDFRPWQEDNDTITAVTWTTESGQVAISSQAHTSGVASALLSFPQSGNNLVSVLATTATVKKKVWLEVYARDETSPADDYGI